MKMTMVERNGGSLWTKEKLLSLFKGERM